jgi:hypothetical protein
MPVLNNPARFGILFLWSFTGLALGAVSYYCYGEEKATPSTSGENRVTGVAVEKKVVEDQATTKETTESQSDSVDSNALVSNAEDPPLLDLTELLSLLGELPSLSDDPPAPEGAQTCESARQPIKDVVKTEPMALATGVDTATVREIAPKASVYGSGKSASSSAQPGMVKLTSSGDEPLDAIATEESNEPLVINPLRASILSKQTAANTPSPKTTASPTTPEQPLPVANSTDQPAELPIATKPIIPKPNNESSVAPKSNTDGNTSQPGMTQASQPKPVADQADEPLVIGSPSPSTKLPSDPPTLVMEDKVNGKQTAINKPTDTPTNTTANETALLDKPLDNAEPMKDSLHESMQEAAKEPADKPADKPADEPASIADELAELLIVPSTRNSDTDTDTDTDTDNGTKGKNNIESNSSTSKPKRKMVTVKVLTEQDQEAPILKDAPREIDSEQARDEDENAAVAKRPQASKKSFVESPSDLSVSLPKDKAVTPPKSNPAKIETAISPAEMRRKQRVESCLSYYIANPETVVERSPWAVMHAMLPFGVEGEVIVGNKRVNSIQWMCYNGTCRTQKMFTPSGRSFRPNVGGGVQGHEGQFLAMLAQSQVSADYPIVVANKRYSVLDLVRYEMATCKEKTELTFKLVALSYYVDTNQAWTAMDRRKWNIEKLVAEELAQPVVGAACGGTHRLMGLTFALRQRKAEGRPIDGHYARADKFIADYIDYTWTLQNPDGSFSSNWFESRGHEQNKERLVQTTGHILEWLMFTLPKDKLEDPRVLKSVDFLLNNIWEDRNYKWPIGPRGHATRAIAIYQQRVYGVQPGQRHTEMAEKIDALKLRR